MSESFVYDGTEVKKTGREAVRIIPAVGRGESAPRKLVLVEITPVDTAFDWKKWVDPAQLYKVLDH